MSFFKKLFRKKKQEFIPPMPSWDTIVEVMYDKQLDMFTDEVVKVVYSKDQTMRYVVLKKKDALFTYQLQTIYQIDEDEWKYIFSDDKVLPATWGSFIGIEGKSFFENEEVLLKEMKAEAEYKQYFG